MNIVYSKQAMKAIKRMDSTTAARIRTAIETLPHGDVKQLKGEGIATYRLRVGGWRVLYSFIDNNMIVIEKIAPRGDVYKRL